MEEMLRWQWLIFELPLLFGLVLLIGSALGAGDGDAADMDGDGDFDGDADADADHAHDLEPGWTARIFGFLGFGKAPMIVVLATMGITYGATGALLTRQTSTLLAPLNAVLALVVMFFVTGWVARTFARLMPKTETYIVSDADFAGKIGKLTLKADTTWGEVQVRDDYGHSHRCKCRTAEGELPTGTQVLLVEYDETQKSYYVERFET